MGKTKETTHKKALPPAREDDHSLDDSERVGSIAFFLALGFLTVAAGFVAAPVLVPLVLAAITAGLADPLKRRVDRLFGKRRGFSAAVTLVIMVVVVLAPLFVVGFFTARTLADLLTQATADAEPVQFLAGDTGRAFLMLILGGGLIAGVDYLVRPLIIRGDAQLHQVLALSGIIGGSPFLVWQDCCWARSLWHSL